MLDFHAGLTEVLGLNPSSEKKFVYLLPLSYKCYVAVLLRSHTYSARAFYFVHHFCHLSVCPASDLGNYVRYV